MPDTILQSVKTTLIDVDAVHVSELPIKVIVSPLGVSISPKDWASDRLALVFLELRQGRLRLVVRRNGDEGTPTHVIDLIGAPEAPVEETDNTGYLLPIWEYQPQQKGEHPWKR
jgi:hypothetical protein